MDLSKHSNLGSSSHISKAMDVSKHSSLGSSSHHRNGTPSNSHAKEANPIKNDDELQLLVGKVDKIQKYKTFQRWKGKFLSRFETFLYSKGMDPAEEAANELDYHLNKLVQKTQNVLDHIHQGNLGADKKTVKASLALNEACNRLEEMRQEIEGVVPSLKSDERRKGYSKFHLGATLIRQGFHQYANMKLVEEHVAEIGTALKDVADRQQHDLFQQYHTQVARFCDVMADLDLYNIMLKCVEFYQPPEDSESEEALTIVVVLQLLQTPRVILDGDVGEDETTDAVVVEKELAIEVEENESVENVRASAATAFGMLVERQQLKFQGITLNDDAKNIEDLGIQENSVLTVERILVPITVRDTTGSDSKAISLRVDPELYLSDLKRALESKTNIPAPNQHLLLQPDDALLEDMTKRLSDYGITAKSVLDLEPKHINVHVDMPENGGRCDLTIAPRVDTAETMKEMINSATRMAVSRQVLVFQGQELPTSNDGVPAPTAKDMGIQQGSVLQVDVFKIPLTVKTWDGNTVDVMADPTAKISDLMHQLEDASGIPADNQVLLHNGLLLEDTDKTLSDQGITAGNLLDLQPRFIKVLVETPDGELHEVNLLPTDDTATIKAKVEAKTGISVTRQVLTHSGKELPVDVTVTDMGIREGTELELSIFKIPVKVEMWDGGTIDLMVDPTESLQETKQLIDLLNPDSGFSPENQSFFFQENPMEENSESLQNYGVVPESVLYLEPKIVNVIVATPNGSVHQVALTPSDDTPVIKQKIQCKTHISSARMVLKHEGEELPVNGKTVKDMVIREGSHLSISIFKIPVIVETWDGKTIETCVDPTWALIETKQLVQTESGIPPSNQVLFYHQVVMDDDAKAVGEYGVTGGSVLYLEPKAVAVNVETPDGQKHGLLLAPSDDCNAIKKNVETVTGIEVPRQAVTYNDCELPCDGSTVKDMKIREGSTIYASVFTIPVTVNTWDGKAFSLTVDPTQPLVDLKENVQKATAIEVKNQALFHGKNQLVDNQARLDELGIHSGAVLFVEPSVVHVTAELPDGKAHDIAIGLSDDCKAIKMKIQEGTGLAMSRQVLKIDGLYLPTGKSAKEMGLTNGSKLNVEILRYPVLVNTDDEKQIKLLVEPCHTLLDMKNLLELQSAIVAKSQILSKDGNLLVGDTKRMGELGIQPGSVVDLKRKEDFIIIIDVKYGTLFGVDRDDAVSRGVLTLQAENSSDFIEATADSRDIEQMRKSMLDSPNLGVKPRIVVEKIDVEDYDLEEAAAVKSKWGVQLKKTQKNQRGSELLFVDAKYSAVGFLDRQKMMEIKLVTPSGHGKDATLQEAENDAQQYDKFVKEIRTVFGVASL